MKTYSQVGQDLEILKYYKSFEDFYFIEIGAYDGIHLSNTYLLEKLGAKGICIEPNKKIFLELIQNRKCLCLPFIVGESNTLKGFNEKGLLGEVEEGDKYIQVSMKEILKNAPKIIQYLSLDVEGNEYNVLSDFPFDTHIVEFIHVEHNLYCEGDANKNKIYDLLTKNNYHRYKENVCVSGVPFEDWYVHNFYKNKTNENITL